MKGQQGSNIFYMPHCSLI